MPPRLARPARQNQPPCRASAAELRARATPAGIAPAQSLTKANLMKISGVDIRPGNILEYEGGIWKVAKIQHTQPGKGGARSEEHTSELQSLMRISYAVFCLTKKNTKHHADTP